ncbi:hypothetical protein [Trichocoleus sp. FACHB-262]|uniref:hypothetical protein n=1 Tax=Trichocoleus sp. FACHB-262 TaxID=2692869 RepID=UPI0016850EFA|nr:hypothetical protein [Trichocoleus sp. FACHB-262]MBD2121462.1 hypothetical protein [Trichocoleus sp. FACHB-262]
MNRLQQLVSFTATALVLVGCAGGDRTAQQNPTPASPSVASSTQTVKTQSIAQQNFSKPIVPPVPVVKTVPVPGLVQPTNATARLPQIASGRRDPFAAVVTSPVVVPGPVTSTSTAARPIPQVAPVPRVVRTAPARPAPSQPAPAPVFAAAPLPQLQPSSPNFATVPLPPPAPFPGVVPLPPTSVANVIEVTGVVQVGQKVSAIIKVPAESTSRYVSEGEYLAGGILVKRIELGTREEPLVVLEQNGVEIVKAVGSAGNTVARAF